jgi:hypothetical protein
LVYVADQVLPAQAGYDVSVYQIQSGENADQFMTILAKGNRMNERAIMSGRQTTEDIIALVPSFTYDATKKIQSFNEIDGAYVVTVHAVKNVGDTIFPTISIPATQQQAQTYTTALTNKVLYSFDDIFVSDTLRRLPAKDPKSDTILNGAYFKYAQVGQSQT